MAEMTKREQVWTLALIRAYRKGKAVHPTEIAEKADVTEKTAREALHAMENNNFLVRRRRNGRTSFITPPKGLTG